MSDPYVWLVVAAIYCGLLTATTIMAVIAYDLIAVRKGWPTVTDQTARLSNKAPFVAITVTACLSLALGILIGHLFLPR